ncbi:MAG: hypothetical protein AB7S75_14765 [Desulfococcaceae bacterium]
MKKQFFVCIRMLSLAVCLVFAASAACPGSDLAIDFPGDIDSPYKSTVIGTPLDYKAKLPGTDVKKFRLTVFPERKIPEMFWYSESLNCSLAAQDEKAPLMFVIAGTGAAYNSAKMKVLQKTFHQAGYHVICISSPTHPNFIVSASQTKVPGHLGEDSRDLYRVMKLAYEEVKEDIDVSGFCVSGYSLGAAQAAYVSYIDEQQRIFNFRRVLMLNPPVSLFNSTAILDNALVNNVPGGLDHADKFMDKVFTTISDYYSETNRIDFSDPDLLYDIYRKKNLDNQMSAALVGVSFRISSANMIVASDIMTRAGFICPSNMPDSPYNPMDNYAVVATRTSFTDYFNEYFYPFFQSRQAGLTKENLIRSLSLQTIESYLKNSDKIFMITNRDDIILAKGELDWLKEVFGSRAVVFDKGGHCGNMDHRQYVARMIALMK